MLSYLSLIEKHIRFLVLEQAVTAVWRTRGTTGSGKHLNSLTVCREAKLLTALGKQIEGNCQKHNAENFKSSKRQQLNLSIQTWILIFLLSKSAQHEERGQQHPHGGQCRVRKKEVDEKRHSKRKEIIYPLEK